MNECTNELRLISSIIIIIIRSVIAKTISTFLFLTLRFLYVFSHLMSTYISPFFDAINDSDQHSSSNKEVLLVVIFHRFIFFLLSFISSCYSNAHVLVHFSYLTYIVFIVFLYAEYTYTYTYIHRCILKE